MRNFTTEDDDTMVAMNKDEIYRYLRHMQSKQIKYAPPNQNDSVTNKIQISPPPCCKGKTYCTTTNGWQRFD